MCVGGCSAAQPSRPTPNHTHPHAPAQAVQGKAFIFDKSSVKLQVDPRTKEGSVYLEGEWEGDGSVYLVKMTPSGGVSRKVGHQGRLCASRPRAAAPLQW